MIEDGVRLDDHAGHRRVDRSEQRHDRRDLEPQRIALQFGALAGEFGREARGRFLQPRTLERDRARFEHLVAGRVRGGGQRAQLGDAFERLRPRLVHGDGPLVAAARAVAQVQAHGDREQVERRQQFSHSAPATGTLGRTRRFGHWGSGAGGRRRYLSTSKPAPLASEPRRLPPARASAHAAVGAHSRWLGPASKQQRNAPSAPTDRRGHRRRAWTGLSRREQQDAPIFPHGVCGPVRVVGQRHVRSRRAQRRSPARARPLGACPGA